MAEPHDDKPENKTPDGHLNKPGMTNGVPDGQADVEATALPNSDREKTETAGMKDA